MCSGKSSHDDIITTPLSTALPLPALQYSAVDSTGNAEASSKGVTALTWGAFPNKEIIQPTIFETETFQV